MIEMNNILILPYNIYNTYYTMLISYKSTNWYIQRIIL